MTEVFADRRSTPRTPLNLPIEVCIEGHRVPGELKDISLYGIQVKVDPAALGSGIEKVESISVDGAAPLAVSVIWELFDGFFGATFVDAEAGEALADRLLSA